LRIFKSCARSIATFPLRAVLPLRAARGVVNFEEGIWVRAS